MSIRSLPNANSAPTLGSFAIAPSLVEVAIGKRYLKLCTTMGKMSPIVSLFVNCKQKTTSSCVFILLLHYFILSLYTKFYNSDSKKSHLQLSIIII